MTNNEEEHIHESNHTPDPFSEELYVRESSVEEPSTPTSMTYSKVRMSDDENEEISSYASHPLHNPIFDNDESNENLLLEQILFFGCGVGSSLCYIATLSSLVYFKIVYGPDSFVDLNLAVYLPLLPISISQAKWDQMIDKNVSSKVAFFFRLAIGFGLSLTGTVRMAVHSSSGNGSLNMLIMDASFQGLGGAVLYGSFNQLASIVGVGDGRRLKAAVSAGFQASALIVLAASLYTGFGIAYNAKQFFFFLCNIIAIECICFIMCLLLLARPSVVTSMYRRDLSIRPSRNYTEVDEEILPESGLDEPLLSLSGEISIAEISYAEIWTHSKEFCYVLVITLVPSFLIGSWFTQVETKWLGLAEVLFYVRIGADLFGRISTVYIPPKTIQSLKLITGLRLFPVILFFVNSRSWSFLGNGNCGKFVNDIISIVLVAIIAFLSGYLVTGCYQLAPTCLPSHVRNANLAKQASLLTVAFSVAAIGGLFTSFALVSIGS